MKTIIKVPFIFVALALYGICIYKNIIFTNYYIRDLTLKVVYIFIVVLFYLVNFLGEIKCITLPKYYTRRLRLIQIFLICAQVAHYSFKPCDSFLGITFLMPSEGDFVMSIVIVLSTEFFIKVVFFIYHKLKEQTSG
jgi:hypothetical protein